MDNPWIHCISELLGWLPHWMFPWIIPIMYPQELMSGEAAKERVTTAYTRVPSKSKLLANELPNKETTFQMKRHSDDIKTTCSVIAM